MIPDIIPRPPRPDPQTLAVGNSALYSHQLNLRIRTILNFILLVFPFLVVAVWAIQGLSLALFGSHLATYAMVLLFVRFARVRDMIVLFLVLHPFVFYNFTLFLYALLRDASLEEGLYAPVLTTLVAAAGLAGCMGGYFLSLILKRVLWMPRPTPPAPASETGAVGIILIVMGAPFLVLPGLIPQVSLITIVSSILVQIACIGIVAFSSSRGVATFRSPTLAAILVVAAFAAVFLNWRANLFIFALATVVVYFGVSKRPFEFVRIIFVYVAMNVLSAFSTVMLAGRIQYGHEGSVSFVLRHLLSVDFVLASLGFERFRELTDIVNNQLDRHDEYLLYLFDGRQGLFERLTEFVPMDIIVGRLPHPLHANWGEIKNLFLFIIPFVGSYREADYNDRLVWELNLYDYGNIGHPTVTAIGEYYAMGGFWFTIAMMAALISIALYFYQISRRVFRNDYVAAGGLLLLTTYLVFTSTSSTALSVVTRGYPLALLVYPMARILYQGFGGSKAAATAPSGLPGR
ncbi:MAG: hypothetical protein ACOY45_04240 [Pseudomonadota bacterium]